MAIRTWRLVPRLSADSWVNAAYVHDVTRLESPDCSSRSQPANDRTYLPSVAAEWSQELCMKSVLVLLFLLAVMAAAIAVVLAKRRKLPSDDAPWPFYAKRPLSHPEQVLYHRLVKALPDH